MNAIICLSGGMDSAVTLAHALANNRSCQTVGFFYGSKHNAYENEAAKNISKYYCVPFELINLEPVMKNFSSHLMKNGGEIPEGHYEDKNMEKTVVPARNIIFTSILAGIAWSNNCQEVWLGIHAGDHAIYPDCRPEFYHCMSAAILAGTGDRIQLIAPFLENTKREVVKKGIELGVPFHLTRTCYKNQSIACGKCGSCRERLEAFADNNVKDPIQYE
jgi:7-cyano-7-deazaguanine synthase